MEQWGRTPVEPRSGGDSTDPRCEEERCRSRLSANRAEVARVGGHYRPAGRCSCARGQRGEMAERETQSPVVGFRNLLFRSDGPPLAYFPRLARAMEPYSCVSCSKVDADLHVQALLAAGSSLLGSSLVIQPLTPSCCSPPRCTARLPV